MLKGAVLKTERAVRVAHVDTAAVALGVVADDADVVELQRALAAVHGDARAVPVAAVVLVGDVAGDGGVGDERARGVSCERDAAGAVPVVAGTAGDQAAVHARRDPGTGVLPEEFITDIRAGVLIVLLARTAVEIEGAAVHVDNVARALRIPLVVAVAQGLAAIDHVAVQVDVVGVAVGHLDAPVGFGVPVGQQVDRDLVLVEIVVAGRDHVVHDSHDVLDRAAVEGAPVALARHLANGVVRLVRGVGVGALRRYGRKGERDGHRGDRDGKRTQGAAVQIDGNGGAGHWRPPSRLGLGAFLRPFPGA